MVEAQALPPARARSVVANGARLLAFQAMAAEVEAP